jgi:hypothetical protein
MKAGHKQILEILERYLSENPEQRFGQALYNLKVNQFTNELDPWKENFRLLDIYNDSDKDILERVKHNAGK